MKKLFTCFLTAAMIMMMACPVFAYAEEYKALRYANVANFNVDLSISNGSAYCSASITAFSHPIQGTLTLKCGTTVIRSWAAGSRTFRVSEKVPLPAYGNYTLTFSGSCNGEILYNSVSASY